MIKLLGILDILTGGIFFVSYFYVNNIFLIFPIYLIIKSLVFIKSIVSFFDILVAIFFIMAIFGNFVIIDWIFIVWIIQKGLFSLLS